MTTTPTPDPLDEIFPGECQCQLIQGFAWKSSNSCTCGWAEKKAKINALMVSRQEVGEVLTKSLPLILLNLTTAAHNNRAKLLMNGNYDLRGYNKRMQKHINQASADIRAALGMEPERNNQ